MKQTEIKASNLFLSHYAFLSGVAFRYAPLPGLGEDIIQQVFAEFVSHADQWDLDHDVRPLLVRITQNIAKRYWREQLRKMPDVMQKIAKRAAKIAEENTEEPRFIEETAALRQCMSKLPEKSRNLIKQHYFDGLSMRTIAEQIQSSDVAVRRAFCDLRKKLYLCISVALKGNVSNS